MSSFVGYQLGSGIFSIRWKDTFPPAAGTEELDAPPWQTQDIDLSKLIDIDRFRGNLWVRYDGTAWTVYPQTREAYQEQVKYAMPPFAPWMPKITDKQYFQQRVAATQPWLKDQINKGYFERWKPPPEPLH